MSHMQLRQTDVLCREVGISGKLQKSPLKAVVALYDLLVLWNSRWQERQHLRELDSRILKDIGLSPAEVWQEARKPFWRP